MRDDEVWRIPPAETRVVRVDDLLLVHLPDGGHQYRIVTWVSDDGREFRSIPDPFGRIRDA